MSRSTESTLPPMKKVLAPVNGWEAGAVYLVAVALSKANVVHRAILHVGFLNHDLEPGNGSLIWGNSYDDGPVMFGGAYYLRVIRKLVHGAEMREWGDEPAR